MKNYCAAIAVIGSALAIQVGSAQELPTMEETGPEHQWLGKFVGTWDVTAETPEGEKGRAVMKSSMMGKLWLVNSADHEISGMKLKSIQMIGYDPKKKKYVGIWADSLMNHMWHYEGTVDDSGKKLTLEAEGPGVEDGKMTAYRDIYEFKDADTIVATSAMQNELGKWKVLMEGTAKRRK